MRTTRISLFGPHHWRPPIEARAAHCKITGCVSEYWLPSIGIRLGAWPASLPTTIKHARCPCLSRGSLFLFASCTETEHTSGWPLTTRQMFCVYRALMRPHALLTGALAHALSCTHIRTLVVTASRIASWSRPCTGWAAPGRRGHRFRCSSRLQQDSTWPT